MTLTSKHSTEITYKARTNRVRETTTSASSKHYAEPRGQSLLETIYIRTKLKSKERGGKVTVRSQYNNMCIAEHETNYAGWPDYLIRPEW